MPKFILKIPSVDEKNDINTENVECFIYNAGLSEDCLLRQIDRAREKGKIVLLEGDDAAVLAVRLDADGIVADLSQSQNIKKEMSALRAKIGSRFLGVICRNRRHEAMIVSENEPDFVIFRIWSEGAKKTKELVTWYEEFFLLQMAVEPMDDEMDFSSFPADIVILSPARYKILVAQK